MPTDPTPTAADLVRDIFAAHGRHRITDGALMDDVARAIATAREAGQDVEVGRRRRLIDRARAEADAAGYARGRAEGLREAVLVNGSTPYPLLDVLRILCEVADHALVAHSCDHHGYEVWGEARDAGRECIRELTRLATVGGSLEAPLTAPPPTLEPTPGPRAACSECQGSGWTSGGSDGQLWPGEPPTACGACRGTGRVTPDSRRALPEQREWVAPPRRCHDCADHDGVCPLDGRRCDGGGS